MMHVHKLYEVNICIFDGISFQEKQTTFNIGFSPLYPCVFAMDSTKGLQKAH